MSKQLNKSSFRFLPMNEIKPSGWLLEQLKTQAQGLSGNLDKFWPDIKDSNWIGGEAEGWERLPYWLDGFIPLAFLLDDEDMKNRAHRYMNSIIQKQEDDGWLCPANKEERSSYDIWALFLILKVLVVYHDATQNDKIEDVIYNALKALDRHIDNNTLFSWGMTRWYEALIAIFWLYERRPEQWMLNLASKLNAQGFDWKDFFDNWVYQIPDEKGRWSQMSHVVNNAMAIKSGALSWRLTGKDDDFMLAEKMRDTLDNYHGMVTGVFTGDECLAGKSPIQGTELCAVAEYMYSIEHVMSITGKSYWGDLLEKIAYNALPATFSPDMWSHQYDQQINQPQCSIQENPIYNTNSGESNLFGLEPNFGCCTANLSQAWPKLATSTFMKTDKGLVAAVYAPCEINTKLNNANVSIKVDTQYPFRDTISFEVKTDKAIEFPLLLRIPEWCSSPNIIIDDKKIEIKEKGYYKLSKLWEGTTNFTLVLPMEVCLIKRPNNLYAISCGPLVYSLAIDEKWVQINKDAEGRQYPHCDYEIYPTSSWNYGLLIDKDNYLGDIKFAEKLIGKLPFSPDGAPIIATIKGKKIKWSLNDGVPKIFPEQSWVDDEICELKFIPYGCTNLRMTEMPIVK